MLRRRQPKNLDESQLPALIMAWTFGYGVIQYPLNNLRTVFSLIYAIIIDSVYVTGFVFTVLHSRTFLFMSSERTYLNFILFNGIIMGMNICKAWIHRHTLVEVSKRNMAIEEILKSFGVPVNTKKALAYCLIVLIIWIISSIIFMVIPLSRSSEFFSLSNITTFCILRHPLHVNECIDLNFVLSMRHMRLRLESINKLLSSFDRIKHGGWMLNINDIAFPTSFNSSRHLKKGSINSPNNDKLIRDETVLRTVKYLHLEVNILCKKIMQIYGLSIIMTMTVTFITLTYLLYKLYLKMIGPVMLDYEVLYKSKIVIWIFKDTIKFIFINYICAQTASEYKKTGEMIYKLDIQSYNPSIRNEIQQFRIQLIQNPFQYFSSGSLELGFPFIRDFAGSVTTYLIILIQINDSSPKSNL